MTMFPPAQYYHKKKYNGHECLYSNKDIHSCYLNDEGEVRSTSSSSVHTTTLMADQENKSSTSNNNNDEEEEEAQRDDEEWLQLSIGGGGGGGGNNNNLVELDLLNQQQQQQQHVFRPPSCFPMFNMAPNIFSNRPLLLQQQGPSSRLYNNPQEMASWSLRPTTTFSPNFVPQDGGGPSSEGRLVLIDPPRNRPHSGIWFMLQASRFQGREPHLPQISKSYLRIKDGRMTVRFIMKYVANKLRLDSESEIEITCRGQHLVPFLTLQHVRDNIWINQRDTPTTTIALLPHSSTEDHVMVLRYGRTRTP